MPQYLSPGVYVEEVPAGTRPIEGVGTAVAAFVGLASKGEFNKPTLCTNWTQFTNEFGDFVEDSYLHHAVYGFFQNGGGICYVIRIGSDAGASNAAAAPVARGELPAGNEQRSTALRLNALSAGTAGNGITVEVTDATAEGAPEDAFKLIVKQGETTEEFDNLSTRRGRQYAVTVVNAQSRLVRLEEASTGTIDKPAKGTIELNGGGEAATTIRPDDYVGDSADRTGFGGLEAVDTVTMVSVPDLMSAYEKQLIDLEGVKAVQLAMIAHCELMGDRVAILDPPPSLNAQQIREWRQEQAGYDSKYATLYWPWVKVYDPASGRPKHVPPSGHVAGIWSRNDDERGVHKAPANEVVRGAIATQLDITKGEQDLLNPIGVNCIHAFPGRGIRIWGARTLSTTDPSWRYINVRRYFNYLEQSILLGTQWCVFEPNDAALWGRIRRTITAFLTLEWRKGALFGLTPDEAFFVRCDSENNTPESIDAGQVICDIAVAPVKPAEFVIFRLSQYSGGASAEE